MAALSSPIFWPTGSCRSAVSTHRASTGSRAHAAEHAESASRGALLARADVESTTPAAPRRACSYVFIANLPHLVEAYGQDFASAASREVQRRLCEHFLTSATADMARLRDDCFLLWANDAFVCGAGDIADMPRDVRSASRPIETLLAVLGAEPVRANGIAALVQLHADWIEVRSPAQLGTSEIELTLWTAQPFPDSRESRADGGPQRYRADMDVAVRVSDALRAEELSFAWQPVVHAGTHASTHIGTHASNHVGTHTSTLTSTHLGTLYRAGRARLAPNRGAPVSLTPEVFMPCLQRLGLARAFDRVAVRQALAALRLQGTAHIGVSISAQSTKLDHWWASMLSALDDEPALASRLVIEITGSAALPDLEAARDFCVQMQLRGCRIALRDFGGGSDNLAAVQACGPDIVKLDASFLRRARDGAFGRDCLRGMVALCAHFASHVVVDGVEREDDVQVAARAGAQWLQGYGVRGAERAAYMHHGTDVHHCPDQQ